MILIMKEEKTSNVKVNLNNVAKSSQRKEEKAHDFNNERKGDFKGRGRGRGNFK